MYSLGQSAAALRPPAAAVHFGLPRVLARYRAQIASSPPPCPLPSGGGWPRARPHTPCARHVADRARRHAQPIAFAAARYARGRNATHAGRRSAFSRGNLLTLASPSFRLRAHLTCPLTASRARNFCLPRVFAPIGHAFVLLACGALGFGRWPAATTAGRPSGLARLRPAAP